MVIEYRIEIEPTGVKITQTVDGNTSRVAPKKVGAATTTTAAAGDGTETLNLGNKISDHGISSAITDPKPGGNPIGGEDPGPGGGGGPADGAVLILGPTFLFPGIRLAPEKKSEDSKQDSHGAKGTTT